MRRVHQAKPKTAGRQKAIAVNIYVAVDSNNTKDFARRSTIRKISNKVIELNKDLKDWIDSEDISLKLHFNLSSDIPSISHVEKLKRRSGNFSKWFR